MMMMMRYVQASPTRYHLPQTEPPFWLTKQTSKIHRLGVTRRSEFSRSSPFTKPSIVSRRTFYYAMAKLVCEWTTPCDLFSILSYFPPLPLSPIIFHKPPTLIRVIQRAQTVTALLS
jgi:hypothetical protein